MGLLDSFTAASSQQSADLSSTTLQLPGRANGRTNSTSVDMLHESQGCECYGLLGSNTEHRCLATSSDICLKSDDGPACPPALLLFTIAITSHEHSMPEYLYLFHSSALGRPTRQGKEWQMTSKPRKEHLQQRLLIIGGHILVAVDGDNVAVLLFGVAGLLESQVLVILLGVDAAVLHDEAEGKVHEASMAAMVPGGITVH